MSVFIKHYQARSLINVANVKLWRYNSSTADVTAKKDDEDEEFRVLDILKKRQKFQKRVNRRADIQPDRSDRMPADQNWGNVWPGPKTFHPSSVPLPMRQGYTDRGRAPPGKKANAELMKVPNFLHLTPPAIKAQCEAIKKFCTEWPPLLNNEEAIKTNYPLEIITSDYCHASPSIRNPLSRIVILRIKLSDLDLDKHAKDKFLRLVGEKYDPETDLVTITADRCPLRKQNLDYVNYLLTACYHEAFTYEDWEKDKLEEDMEEYIFDNNQSKVNLVDWAMRANGDVKELTKEDYKKFDVNAINGGAEHKEAVGRYFNEGESAVTLKNYDAATRKLLGLPQKLSEASVGYQKWF